MNTPYRPGVTRSSRAVERSLQARSKKREQGDHDWQPGCHGKALRGDDVRPAKHKPNNSTTKINDTT